MIQVECVSAKLGRYVVIGVHTGSVDNGIAAVLVLQEVEVYDIEGEYHVENIIRGVHFTNMDYFNAASKFGVEK